MRKKGGPATAGGPRGRSPAYALFGILLLVETACTQEERTPAPTPPTYVGADGCRSCHSTRGLGDQFGRWQQSAHARAFRTLAGPRALQVAAALGIASPQADDRCLRCHTTGREGPPRGFASTFRVADGVQCEACHGPGSGYRTRAAMLNPRQAEALGLLRPDATTCSRCHNAESPTFKGFDYEAARRSIAHPLAEAKPLATETAIAWETSIDRARSIAAERKVPILVDFHCGRGCASCEERLAAFDDPRVAELARQAVPVRIADPERRELERLGLAECGERIELADGRVVKEVLGGVGPEVLAHTLRRALELNRRQQTDAARESAGAAAEPVPGDATGPARAAVARALEAASSGLEASPEGAFRELLAAGGEALRLLSREAWSMDRGRRKRALRLLVRTLELRWQEWRAREVAWSIAPEIGSGGRPLPVDAAPEEVVLDLLAFLSDSDVGLRVPAADALGFASDRRATAPLLRCLAAGEEAGLTQAALRALEHVKDPASARPLLDFAIAPPCGDRKCPDRIDALTILHGLAGPPEAPDLIELLRDGFVCLPAVCDLGAIGTPGAFTALFRLASDDRQPFQVRNEILLAAREHLSLEAAVGKEGAEQGETAAALLEPLRALLQDPHPDLRAGAVAAMRRAWPLFGSLLEAARIDPSVGTRANAALTIASFFSPTPPGGSESATPSSALESAHEALERLANEPTALPRTLALIALGRMGHDTRFLLREELRAPKARFVEERRALAEAARALLLARDVEAVPLATALLDEQEPETSRIVGACLDAVAVRLGTASCPRAAVPAELPRQFVAGAGGALADAERARILARTSDLVAFFGHEPFDSPVLREPVAGPRLREVKARLLEIERGRSNGGGGAAGAAGGPAVVERQGWVELSFGTEGAPGQGAGTEAACRVPLLGRIRVLDATNGRLLQSVTLTPAIRFRRFQGIRRGEAPGLPRFAVHVDEDRVYAYLGSTVGPLSPLPEAGGVVEFLGPDGVVRAACEK
ncbi:MAG: hypothetical protein HYZ53_19045 [Planctomycetes bacterium]|nr:hypothetical protein [Planctomycetota bacterium]